MPNLRQKPELGYICRIPAALVGQLWQGNLGLCKVGPAGMTWPYQGSPSRKASNLGQAALARQPPPVPGRLLLCREASLGYLSLIQAVLPGCLCLGRGNLTSGSTGREASASALELLSANLGPIGAASLGTLGLMEAYPAGMPWPYQGNPYRETSASAGYPTWEVSA